MKARAVVVCAGLAALIVAGVLAAQDARRFAALKSVDHAAWLAEAKARDRKAWLNDLVRSDYAAYLEAIAEDKTPRRPSRSVRKSSQPRGDYPGCEIVYRYAPKVAAENFLRARLKNPRGARFSGPRDTVERYAGDCAFAVEGFVDATNDYGGTIRTRYTVAVQYSQADQTWTLIAATTDQE